MTTIHRPSSRVVTRSRAAATALAAALSASIASTASAHEGDVGLLIEGGQITTHLITNDDFVPARVFASHLGEFGVPGVGDEPGFDGEPGTFAPGSFISFTIEAPLKVWDGAGWVTTALDPLDGERMSLTFSTLSVTTGDGVVEGFPLAVAPDGEWHVHYVFELLPAPGEFAAEPGAYLLELTLHTTQTGVESCEPLWIVFNNELDDAEFDAIVEEAIATLPGAGCPGDVNDDDVVDGNDLAIILGAWGPCAGCLADITGDGIVDGNDLAIILGQWGPCE